MLSAKGLIFRHLALEQQKKLETQNLRYHTNQKLQVQLRYKWRPSSKWRASHRAKLGSLEARLANVLTPEPE